MDDEFFNKLSNVAVCLRSDLRPSKTFLKKARRVYGDRYNYLVCIGCKDDYIIEQILYRMLKKLQKIKIRCIKSEAISKMKRTKVNQLTKDDILNLKYSSNVMRTWRLIKNRVSDSFELKNIIYKYKQKIKHFEAISENIIYTVTDKRYWKNRKEETIKTTKKFKEELISRAWHPSRLDWVMDCEQKEDY